jgi:hypothetical protein
MSQADVLNLVTGLSNGQADLTLAAGFYTDAINELADRHFLTTTSLAGYVEGQTELAIPAAVRSLLAVIYNDVQIDEMTLRQLEHVDSRWRDRQGKPRGWTRETETAKTLALYPTPDVSAQPYVSGPVLGTGYPQFSGVLIYSGFRDPVPQQLELIIVFWILAREYSRESNHQNAEWAAFAENMVSLLMEMFDY